jgi:hypothetical protein
MPRAAPRNLPAPGPAKNRPPHRLHHRRHARVREARRQYVLDLMLAAMHRRRQQLLRIPAAPD